jgi:hypothetical protein
MSLWRIICLFLAFGVTLAIYVVWAITVGGVNLIQFVAVWFAMFLGTRATAGAAYLVAVLGALVLTFPISTFIYFPQGGGAQFTGSDLFFKQLNDTKTYIMFALYIVALCGALYLLRNRQVVS